MSFSNVGLPGLIVILLIIIVLFGGKRIAEVAKGLGTGVKNFKDAVKEDEKSEEPEVKAVAQEPKVTKKRTAAPKKTAAKTTAKTKTKTISKKADSKAN
ncbi:MAG: twin-arginine translocase TatA/TatE family subunit [Campylobacteraceae bacterium]|jgi:sec-independent protein translocase protein TatA|nr:twin-arginine translocase TatA/TatE family subunit [Campylobacteraceae bacterium]